jgi:peptidoglycan-associated lipoprotein
MRDRSSWKSLVLLTVVLALASAGCRKKKAVVDTAAKPPAPAPTETTRPPAETDVRPEGWDKPPTEVRELEEPEPTGRLATVYFDYDSSELRPDTTATLRENAGWLKSRGEVTVAVEGHCDERGTIEYNLALGERRANAVRDYLADLGVPRDRVRVVSYGEERPARPGHDESAWSMNRRAEFVVGQ